MSATLKTPSAADRTRADWLLAMLREHYPDAHCELVHSAPHELLIATILSAQTTDVNVNKATPALFVRFPTPADYARSTPAEIEPFVRSLGFFRNKARAVQEAMTRVVDVFGGKVPGTMDELLSLRGVARKTANVVLGNAFGVNVGVVVDTHVERLSQRLGLAPKGSTVAVIEKHLMSLFPQEAWCDLSHLLIFHGRRACTARGQSTDTPGVRRCSESAICREFGECCELRKVVKARSVGKPKAGALTPKVKVREPKASKGKALKPRGKPKAKPAQPRTGKS